MHVQLSTSLGEFPGRFQRMTQAALCCNRVHFILGLQKREGENVRATFPEGPMDENRADLVLIQNFKDFSILFPFIVGQQDGTFDRTPLAVRLI